MTTPAAQSQQPQQQPQQPAQGPDPSTNPNSDCPTVSNAELKKRAKADKQAKRAARKEATTGGGGGPDAKAVTEHGARPPPPTNARAANTVTTKTQRGDHRLQDKSKNNAKPSAAPVAAPVNLTGSIALDKHAKRDSQPSSNRLFRHFTIQRRIALGGVHKDVHPVILAYGLQVSNYQLCGSTARCLGMLNAFKEVIRSYTIPPDNALARHFIPHVLSHQIDYIKSCRSLSAGMGNAIRHFKEAIVKIGPEMSEGEAKAHLVYVLDNFIRERIIAADTVIAEEACKKIMPGDVLLTFGRSNLVAITLARAMGLGKKFKVVVVDSKPLYEGQEFAQRLGRLGLEVEYYMISGVHHAMPRATKVMVGAHAMMSDGRLHSRIGTAVIAHLAHEQHVPVIVCCESYKFSDKIYVDSFGGNELAPPEELLRHKAEREVWAEKMDKVSCLQMVNMMYDLTPAECVSMVITELGPLPSSSVPAILRMLEGKSVG